MSLVAGCGVKAPPVVPHSPVPQIIKDLTAFSRRGMIALQWSIPKKDSDGKRLINLGGFYIWRQFIPIEQINCATCTADFQRLVDIDYQAPQNAIRGKDRITYWDYQVEQDGKYTYKVTTYTTSGVKGNVSNPATVNWSSPLPPPHHVKAIPGDQVVNLSWEFSPLSQTNSDREPLGGFNIYRRYSDRDYSLTPLHKDPILKNTFRDLGVTNGEKYYYVVRSLKNTTGGTIESEDSIEAGAIPEDLTPPASPSVTMAFQAQDGIVIIWEPNPDSDLDGYYIYRRLETEDIPTLISPLIKRKTVYLDTTFLAELTYYYSVTAVDGSPRRNESDLSQELKVVTATHKRE